MRRSSALSILGLSLALLFATAAPTGQTASAQKAETPGFDVNAPISSLRTADLSTEQKRVELATRLLEARADTEISHATYKDGVQFFKNLYPEFYGNFFGDPFYATYDVQYIRLVRARQHAELDVNPRNDFWDPTSFFCFPFSYDPAFGGECVGGFTFAASDFFFIPAFLEFSFFEPRFFSSSASRISTLLHRHRYWLAQHRWDRSPHHSPGRKSTDEASPPPVAPIDPLPEAPRREVDVPTIASGDQPDRDSDEETSSDPSADRSPSEDARVPDHSPRQVRIPDDIHRSIQETATSLRDTEIQLRLQRHIQEEYGGHENLSPRERAALTSHLSRVLYTSERQDGTSSQRTPSSELERLSEQINFERPSRREAARSVHTERTDRRQSVSAPHSDSRNNHSDARSPDRNSSRPTADTPERDRPDRPKSRSKKVEDNNDNN